MYSGHLLLYVIKTNIDELRDIFDIDDDIDYIYDFINSCDEVFEEYKFLKILRLPCCYFDDYEVYIGVQVGELLTQYRDSVEKYTSLENYLETYRTKLKETEDLFVDNRNLIDSEIDKLFHDYPKISEFVSKSDFEFITIPNDCESCT